MCGVFGIRAPERDVARVTYFGLFALQHRGQESAGIAVSDAGRLTVLRDMGLVAQVFDEQNLSGLQGEVAIGHTRYSTTGSSVWRNSQPVYRGNGHAEFALAHNGNLVNTTELAEELGMLPGAVTSDSDVVAELVVRELPHARDESGLVGALARVLPKLRGDDTSRLRRALTELLELLLGQPRDAWGKAANITPEQVAAAPFPDSAEKVRRMLERLDAEGFTDFYG